MLINKSTVPKYLINSAFYNTLRDNNEDITIPDGVTKVDDSVDNESDFISLLSTAYFWETRYIPTSLIKFCLQLITEEYLRMIVDRFGDKLGYLLILLQVKCAPDKLKMIIAAASKYVQILAYLHIEAKLPWSKEVCRAATHSNQLESLKYAHENGCDWYHISPYCRPYLYHHRLIYGLSVIMPSVRMSVRDYTVCTSAARAGSIACLRYAHQNGCSWDGTCIAAAENGMLECLMFAHENGCLWDRYNCSH